MREKIMLDVSNVSHKVSLSDGSDLPLLHQVSLSVAKGESIAIIGASGSGKTTLITLMATLDLPSSGSILIDGQDVTVLNEEARAQIRARYIAFVFQNFQLLDGLTAAENVTLPLEVRGVADAHSVAQDYLQDVGLGERRDHYPAQLSGGEQQRVALARAFACRAPLLFADEPTGNLDVATGAKIADLLFQLNRQEGTSLILVTHDAALAARCDKRYQMTAGHLELLP
jgi:putative ABC transport system ATP-binding protein